MVVAWDWILGGVKYTISDGTLQAYNAHKCPAQSFGRAHGQYPFTKHALGAEPYWSETFGAQALVGAAVPFVLIIVV